MEKSNLARFIEANLKTRQETKAKILCDGPYIHANDPRYVSEFSFRSVIASLTDRARFARKQEMYRLSGSMGSKDMVRFDPRAHGVANGH